MYTYNDTCKRVFALYNDLTYGSYLGGARYDLIIRSKISMHDIDTENVYPYLYLPIPWTILYVNTFACITLQLRLIIIHRASTKGGGGG